jgi:hypothetical protein
MKRNFITNLPDQFSRNTVEICGESGERWLNDLPLVIDNLSKIWNIEVERPFQNLSYNFVAPCIGFDGSGAVLKIALP